MDDRGPPLVGDARRPAVTKCSSLCTDMIPRRCCRGRIRDRMKGRASRQNVEGWARRKTAPAPPVPKPARRRPGPPKPAPHQTALIRVIDSGTLRQYAAILEQFAALHKRPKMTDLEYKGWKIELRSNKATDAEGWRAYVTVSGYQSGSVRTVPLSYKDARPRSRASHSSSRVREILAAGMAFARQRAGGPRP